MRVCGECTVCSRQNACEWLKGKFGEEARPDKSGVMFTLTGRRNELKKEVLTAHETYPGSLSKTSLLQDTASKELVLISRSMRMIGPREKMDLARQVLSRSRHQ